MLKSHEQFHSVNGRRQLLVVDDEAVNREILGAYLEDEYEILYAADGEEAMQVIRANSDMLSLILLDILMPVMSGIEVLQKLKADMDLSRIPVIVLTADQKAEVDCLSLGAADFIPKPYPAPDVVRARVRRTVELSEDREIIASTEHDALSGLYNKDYFLKYTQQYDQHHKDASMDAVIIDINHFHLVNERYGKSYGDEVLRTTGERIQEALRESGGFACRSEADTFLIYIPHREDHKDLLDRISASFQNEGSAGNRIRFRMGVYSDADKGIDIERRFDRAKTAADTVKGSFTRTIAYYDSMLNEKEVYSEQLIEDFYKAIEEKQFVVYYQPKYDIQSERPVLGSAEALVRWVHPTLGMISPGVFIPLFEENGLIQPLDNYVWREVCRQIAEWKERLGSHVPVSVNVSRIDLYDPELFTKLQGLIREYGISYDDLLLEVTESAYTHDAEQIIDVVERLRKIGFKIEMDDFGTGYSSLNMVSSLPFDVLKLDMQFIRNAFREGGDTRMLELIIDIADYLSVPIIAEGVETKDQVDTLKAMGCHVVQGYYFSRPVPAAEFEAFILENVTSAEGREAGSAAAEKAEEVPAAVPAADEADGAGTVTAAACEEDAAALHEAASAAEDGSGGMDIDTFLRTGGISEIDSYSDDGTAGTLKAERSHNGLQMRTANIFFVLIALITAAALFLSDMSVTRGYERMERASDRYIAAQLAAANLEAGSDYLTDRVRCFVVTGEMQYMKEFFEEVEETRSRDLAVDDLETLIGTQDAEALVSLNTALRLSNELVSIEHMAMRLKLEAEGADMTGSAIPDGLASLELSPEDLALSKEELNHKAQDLVFNNDYMHTKDRIRSYVSQCTQSLIHASSEELEAASSRMSYLITLQTIITVLFLLIVLAIVIFINQQIRRPISQMVSRMQAQEPITPSGAEELQFVAETYNQILQENQEAREKLRHEASHDALTGLLNRGAYDLMMQSIDTSHIAMILVDVDYFKTVNDTYGHAMGDRILKRVAEILKGSFRSVDIICRIGGDEFAVIMTRVNSSMRQLVKDKIARANDLLQHPKDDLPPVSLSVGVAFSDRENPRGDIFRDADTALYRVKEGGKNGCEIY